MKKKTLISSFYFFVIFYIVGAAMAWNLNPGRWYVEGRIICCIFLILTLILNYAIRESNDKPTYSRYYS